MQYLADKVDVEDLKEVEEIVIVSKEDTNSDLHEYNSTSINVFLPKILIKMK